VRSLELLPVAISDVGGSLGPAGRTLSIRDRTDPALGSTVAELIVYLISRPPHVNISTLDILPTQQV
jgi:NADP-dependent 3-hydroxy acid dehydrogenase YdfG